MKKNKYDYNTFKELFDHHISYAYESQYGAYIRQISSLSDVAYVSFHKLNIFANGKLEYKGNWETYDPRLWKKVLTLAKLLIETKAEKVLYGRKQQGSD